MRNEGREKREVEKIASMFLQAQNDLIDLSPRQSCGLFAFATCARNGLGTIQ